MLREIGNARQKAPDAMILVFSETDKDSPRPLLGLSPFRSGCALLKNNN